LTEKHIVDFRKKLESEGLQPATVYKNIKVIKKLVRLAIKQRIIDRNPFSNIKIKRTRSKRQYLDRNEISAFHQVDASTNSYQLAKDVFLFSVFTGLRFGDICTLQPKYFIRKNDIIRLKILIQKTKEPLEYNLNNKAKEILLRYLSIGDKRYVFPMLSKCQSNDKTTIRKKIES